MRIGHIPTATFLPFNFLDLRSRLPYGIFLIFKARPFPARDEEIYASPEDRDFGKREGGGGVLENGAANDGIYLTRRFKFHLWDIEGREG